jgi:hypothetical protein
VTVDGVLREVLDYARLDQCRLTDSLQQNTPETGETFVLIVHPHHPLVGQRVRSIRQTGPETDRQWIIELDDQTCSRIPLSWAVPDDQSTPPEAHSPPADLWADVTGLLKLAKMVRNLQANKSTEVTCDEATTGNPTGNACNPDAAKPRNPVLGETVIRNAPGNNDSIDDHDGQAAAGPGQGAR